MRIFLALVAHLFFASIQAEIPAVLFQGITKQFKDPHYSPLMGRVALDSGLIYNYRMYGNFIPAYKKDEPEKRIFVNDEPQDAPMALLLQLFPSSAGELASSSTAESNFGKSATIDDVVQMLKYAKAVRNIMEDEKYRKLDRIKGLDKIFPSVKLRAYIRAYIRDSILLENKKVILTPSNSSSENSRSSTPTSSSDEDSSTPTSSGKSTPKSKSPQSPTLQAIEGDVLYPNFTTEQIILAFFVFQFNTKGDLDELMTKIGDDFLQDVPSTDLPDLDQIFINTYHDINAPIPYKEGDPISNGSCPYITMNANGEKVFDLTKTYPFADCQETALREVMNIILFDKESDTFKLPEGIQNKYLINFYAKQKPISSNDGSPFMRGAWNLVVGGIPDVRYNEKNGNNLDPGFLNTIKVLRHILEIDMDKPLPNNKEDVIAAFKDIIQYLNQSFKDVQIEINNFSEKMTHNGKDFFGTAHIQVTNQDDKTFSFQFYQDTGHGAVRHITYKTTVPTLSESSAFKYPLMNLIDQRNPKKGLYTLFADGALLDDNQKLDLLKRVTTEMNSSYEQVMQRVISSLTVRDDYNTGRLIKVYIEIVKRGFMYEAAIKAASQGIMSINADVIRSALSLFKDLFEKGQGYKEAIEIASQGITSTNDKVRSSISLFKALVEKGQGYTEAIEAASQGIMSHNDNLRDSALVLFKALVEKGQGYTEAIEAASQGIMSHNDNLALVLFKALVEKGQGYTEAIEAASQGVTSTDRYVRCEALGLFTSLVEKWQEQIYDKALNAASQGAMSTDDRTRNSALNLYKALVEKGQGYTEALNAASQGATPADYSTRASALNLYKALVEKGQGYTEAIEAASQGVTSTDICVIHPALDLFKALFEKEQGYETAIKLASQGATSADYSTRNSALNLFYDLFKKGKGYDKAIEVASQGMTSTDKDAIYSALNLFKALVENGQTQIYDRAIEAVSQGMTSNNWFVRHTALGLYKALLEKGQGIEELRRVIGSIQDEESKKEAENLLAQYNHLK